MTVPSSFNTWNKLWLCKQACQLVLWLHLWLGGVDRVRYSYFGRQWAGPVPDDHPSLWRQLFLWLQRRWLPSKMPWKMVFDRVPTDITTSDNKFLINIYIPFLAEDSPLMFYIKWWLNFTIGNSLKKRLLKMFPLYIRKESVYVGLSLSLYIYIFSLSKFINMYIKW